MYTKCWPVDRFFFGYVNCFCKFNGRKERKKERNNPIGNMFHVLKREMGHDVIKLLGCSVPRPA